MVVGFAFTPDLQQVVLIRKRRPEWQAGRLNGVGGKIEEQETPRQAMSREFDEEAGVRIPPAEWAPFAVLTGDGYRVHFFATINAKELRSRTDEIVEVHRTLQLPYGEMIRNLAWLIPMGMYDVRGEPYRIEESD